MDTLTRMRAFVAVVDHEGYSSAARAMGRSKALLSKYVRELEDEVSSLLLNRTTRQFSLTEAGHTYYARAVALLREFDELQDMMREARAGLSGKVRLSAPRTFADTSLGQSLIDFCKQNPEVQLDIELDDRFVDLVEEGFDLAIRMSTLDDSSLIAKRVSAFRVAAYASPATIKKYGMPKLPEDAVNLPWVVDTNARRRDVIPFHDGEGNSKPLQVKSAMFVNSPLATKSAALAGLGFAMCPEFVVRDEVEQGLLVPVLEDYLKIESGIYAVFPHRRYLPAKIRALVDFLADWFKKYDATIRS
ncbi:LysR family transcriptional regulator [Ahrensia kielensis]|uniref:LysR family transcriptional regulator n=1 Tax=Ahrensia kielensis TaxID=76980 RepID=UPI00035F600D|nr:LysR family transcriptional regulator [Ahrensia kielensis]